MIAWADKFKFETVEGAVPQSFVLTVLRQSGIVSAIYRRAIRPLGERITMAFVPKAAAR